MSGFYACRGYEPDDTHLNGLPLEADTIYRVNRTDELFAWSGNVATRGIGAAAAQPIEAGDWIVRTGMIQVQAPRRYDMGTIAFGVPETPFLTRLVDEDVERIARRVVELLELPVSLRAHPPSREAQQAYLSTFAVAGCPHCTALGGMDCGNHNQEKP